MRILLEKNSDNEVLINSIDINMTILRSINYSKVVKDFNFLYNKNISILSCIKSLNKYNKKYTILNHKLLYNLIEGYRYRIVKSFEDIPKAFILISDLEVAAVGKYLLFGRISGWQKETYLHPERLKAPEYLSSRFGVVDGYCMYAIKINNIKGFEYLENQSELKKLNVWDVQNILINKDF